MKNKSKIQIVQYLVIVILLMSCTKEKERADYIIHDALYQAISLEKLPEVSSLFGRDSIYIYPMKLINKDSISFDSSIIDNIPTHVDRWFISVVDSAKLISLSNSRGEQGYIILNLIKKNTEYRVNLMVSKIFKDGYEKHIFDRGKISMYFKYDKYWKIDRMYYGREFY